MDSLSRSKRVAHDPSGFSLTFRPLRLIVEISLFSVAESPKWTDVASVIVASVGVVATLAAVLVALFGPRYHARRSRPMLSLVAHPPGMGLAVEFDDSAEAMQLLLRNRPGQDTARDVEIFASVSAEREDGASTEIVVEYEPLVFENPLGSNGSRTSGTVPAGFSRPVWFALVGQRQAVARAFTVDAAPEQAHDVGAAVTIDPYVRSWMPWLEPQVNYDVKLVVTGSNFDAVTLGGRLRGEFGQEPVDDSGATVKVIVFEWTEEPRQIDDPRPGTPWLAH